MSNNNGNHNIKCLLVQPPLPDRRQRRGLAVVDFVGAWHFREDKSRLTGVPKRSLSKNMKFAVTPLVLTPFVPFREPRNFASQGSEEFRRTASHGAAAPGFPRCLFLLAVSCAYVCLLVNLCIVICLFICLCLFSCHSVMFISLFGFPGASCCCCCFMCLCLFISSVYLLLIRLCGFPGASPAARRGRRAECSQKSPYYLHY